MFTRDPMPGLEVLLWASGDRGTGFLRGVIGAGEGRASRGEAMTALASPKRARKRGKLPRLVAFPG